MTDVLLERAIRSLVATEEERTTLRLVLRIEGFGGREENASDEPSAKHIAEERLEWLRQQRLEGAR